uniref:Rab-GAP TBC domain-containing protein n=1 Tax=Trichobilharzia regenti TaxID=157069 RepID=A0AA85JVD7_TRIRE|nr:unnamed protein product [Trichobilharzia regenti]
MRLLRHKQMLDIIHGENVNIEELKKLSIDGCPDSDGTRSRVWKFLLNYLPCSAAKREERIAFNRRQYEGYVKEFVFESCAANSTPADHPLNLEPDGSWITFFRDNEVLLQINKDCQRLCPDFDFFRRPTEFSCSSLFGDVPIGVLRRRGENSALQSQSLNKNLVGAMNMIHTSTFGPYQSSYRLSSGLATNLQRSKGSRKNECSVTSPHEEPHWEVIERILYIYYKTHVSQGYVQGMNEIIAPIYYVFATDPDESWRRYAEMDTFYCFNNLMTEIHPNFIRKLDGSREAGLGGQMKILSNLLSRYDSHLSKHFAQIDLVPEHFAFRWLSLLLAREFMLPDVLLLWDALFSDQHRFDLLPYVCCSMLINVRDQLLKADFPVAVQLVQNYPSNIDVRHILLKARTFYAER